MELPLYQADAFGTGIFSGNPAAIVPLESWIPDDIMQSIAEENNLAETAFFVRDGEKYTLRWFTPTIEVDLCGHATLASAHILFQELGYNKEAIVFSTRSGDLIVTRYGEEKYHLDFPADHVTKVDDSEIIETIENGLSLAVDSVWKGKDDYLAILDNEKQIRQLEPEFTVLSRLPSRGLIASAIGEDVDFVSRGFFPQTGVNEDPATGSAHTVLTPFWSPRLRKNKMSALQLSSRLGSFTCIYRGKRVSLIGNGYTYMKGNIHIS